MRTDSSGKSQCDLIPALTMSEAICTKPQEEYEDDFEKDLDWLISEEGHSEDQVNEASVHVTVYAATLCLSSYTDPTLSTAGRYSGVLSAALTALCSCFCESVMTSVELRELACLCVLHGKPTLLTHSGVAPPVGPSLHAILTGALRHVCDRMITLVTC